MKGASWSKEQRQKAKDDDKGLWSVCIDNRQGKWESWGLMGHELCTQLWMFSQHLYKGMTPREAFDLVWPPE